MRERVIRLTNVDDMMRLHSIALNCPFRIIAHRDAKYTNIRSLLSLLSLDLSYPIRMTYEGEHDRLEDFMTEHACRDIEEEYLKQTAANNMA